MPVEIFLIGDQVCPKPALPYPPLSFAGTACRNPFALFDREGELPFEQIPPGRKICIALWQCPDAMQMVGQHHDRIDMKWMSLFNVTKCLTHISSTTALKILFSNCPIS
jgi:hypothetical protein